MQAAARVGLALAGDDLLRAAHRVALAGVLVLALAALFVLVMLGGVFGLFGGGQETAGGGALAEIPAGQLLAMQGAADASGCGLPWPVLAAIARQESQFGRNMAPSSAGAIGYGQFLPDTWALYGQGGNPYDYHEAVPAMARYLCALGAGSSLEQALWSYSGCNPLQDSTCHRTDTYVQDALALARRYVAPPTPGQDASGPLPPALDGSVVPHALHYLGVPYLWGGTSRAAWTARAWSGWPSMRSASPCRAPPRPSTRLAVASTRTSCSPATWSSSGPPTGSSGSPMSACTWARGRWSMPRPPARWCASSLCSRGTGAPITTGEAGSTHEAAQSARSTGTLTPHPARIDRPPFSSSLPTRARTPSRSHHMDTTKVIALFQNLITIGIEIGIPACAFFFAWGAYKYMSAGGSPRGMESGKTAMTNALMGLAGVMLATVVATLVGSALK